VRGAVFLPAAGRCARVQPPVQSASHGGNLEAFLVSLGIVALAEIGDKTQLLALVLARATGVRSGDPGILVATLANTLWRLLGAGSQRRSPEALRWILGCRSSPWRRGR